MTTTILDQLQENLLRDLLAFLPELVLCGTIVLLLLLRMISGLNRLHLGYVALLLTVVAFVYCGLQWNKAAGFDPRQSYAPVPASIELFTGLLVYDNFTIFLKLFLVAFAALMILLTLLTGIPDRDDSADFHVLLLGATLGMMLMASANHLLMIFMAIEMASLPSYAMAGFLKGRRKSSEAALKYVVYGGGAAGVMLYGISLLAGKFGTCYLPDVATGMVNVIATTGLDPMLMLGVLFILIGFAFKLAAVPFHFWCPDVFEGASAEVAGFLSVASKGAALAVVGRFTFYLVDAAPNDEVGKTIAGLLGPILAVLAIVTATFGNLAALPQTNLKRLLAYSTIAHAGYMLMGLATLTQGGASAVLFYLIAYLFMNLGAFAIVAFIRNQTGSEDLADLRGLVTRAPVLVISLAICLLSLLGMPPLAGFVAKLRIFMEVFNAGNMYSSEGLPVLSSLMYVMLFVLGINSVISLVYYVKVLKVMIIDKPLEEVEGRTPALLPVPLPSAAYAALIGAVLIVLGIFFNLVLQPSGQGTRQFQGRPTAAMGQGNDKLAQEVDR